MESINKPNDEPTQAEWKTRLFNSHLIEERIDNLNLIDMVRPLQREYDDRMMSFQMALSADRELMERQDREARQQLGISEERLGQVITTPVHVQWEELEAVYRREASERDIWEQMGFQGRAAPPHFISVDPYINELENDDQITW